MRVWSFIFPSADAPILSARVAAATKAAALGALEEKLGLGLGACRFIGQFLGHDELARGVVILKGRSLDLPPANPGRASGVGGAAASETSTS